MLVKRPLAVLPSSPRPPWQCPLSVDVLPEKEASKYLHLI